MISKNILNLIFDPQGTHFIQKIILGFRFENINNIFKIILSNFMKIVNNSSGVCVIKALISKY
jgi:hypothetical protein